ncbi:MAG: hypothetical protein R3A13_07690 [Bdellovibrionota bacterium]
MLTGPNIKLQPPDETKPWSRIETIATRFGIDADQLSKRTQSALIELIRRSGDTSERAILLSELYQLVSDLRVVGFEFRSDTIRVSIKSKQKMPADIFEQSRTGNPLDALYAKAYKEAGNAGAHFFGWTGPASETKTGYSIGINLYRIVKLPTKDNPSKTQ